MREVKGLRSDYENLDKNISLREDSIQEMYEIIRQYNERNKDLQVLLDWSRPIKAKLQEPIPDIRDISSLQAIITDHKVCTSLYNFIFILYIYLLGLCTLGKMLLRSCYS